MYLKYRAFIIPLLIMLVIGILVFGPKEQQELHLTGPTMGTIYNVKLSHPQDVEPTALQNQIDTLLVNINKLMSTYDPESELSQFNSSQSTDWYPLSEQTLVVLKEAKRLGELSNGVLDVTVGPLVNLWGFGPDAKPETVPSEQEIVAVRQRIGLDKLLLSEQAARKTVADLYVDLSTIAKGYAVDQIAVFLEQAGYTDYLVEIGGEMRVSGVKTNGLEWRIAIEKPVSTERSVQRVMSIGSNAVATSGDYRNYYEQDGVRYSHLIDPSTGFPIQHSLVSVTVIHPSSMTADGLATALIVMGLDKALELARQNNLSVLLIARENDQYKEYTTGNFDDYVKAAYVEP